MSERERETGERAEESRTAGERAEEGGTAGERAEESRAAKERAEEGRAAVEKAEEGRTVGERAEEDRAAKERAEEGRTAEERDEEDSSMGEGDAEALKLESETLRMEIESRSRNEEFARVAVAVFMSRLNPTMEEIDDVKTAVSEAVTNGIIHGYQGKPGILYLEVSIQGKELTVEVKDTGVGIADVKKAMEPMYTTDRTGERSGMGFSFMEAFMDEVQVESAPGQGTRVTMKRQIGR